MVETQQKGKLGRVGEVTLSILGGVFGVLGGLFAVMFGGVQSAVGGAANSSNVGVNGWFAILFATLALVAIFYISSKPKVAGWMLVVSAIGGLISISFFYVLSFILLLIAGIMCLTRGRDKKEQPLKA